MLTERQMHILRLIIQIYTTTETPVGSKTLMSEGVNASSATIRNDMKVLEEHELIEKTHSSSGRIPSMKGYRFYVDNLLTPVQVSRNEMTQIKGLFQKSFSAINDIIEQSAKILSDLTSYTAISLGPEVKDRTLTGFRVVPLNKHQLIAIIVTDNGNVESQVFTKNEHVSSEDVEKIVRIINDRLVGKPLLAVYQKLRTEIPLIIQKYFQSPIGILDIFDSVFHQSFEDRVYVSGQMNLLNFDVLTDLSQFKSVYSLMEDQDELTDLIVPEEKTMDIRIGGELNNEVLNNLSLIRASYEVKGHGQGTIALLGPTNMSYEKMFGLLDAFRLELAKQLSDYYHSLD